MPIHLSHRGRGTIENPPNRFEATSVVSDDGAWEEIARTDPDFAPRRTPTTYLRDESRTLISRVNLVQPNPADIRIWASKDNNRVFAADSLGARIDWVAIIPVARLDESAAIYRDKPCPTREREQTRESGRPRQDSNLRPRD